MIVRYLWLVALAACSGVYEGTSIAPPVTDAGADVDAAPLLSHLWSAEIACDTPHCTLSVACGDPGGVVIGGGCSLDLPSADVADAVSSPGGWTCAADWSGVSPPPILQAWVWCEGP